MLIKLSGERYVNAECIESIDKRIPSDGYSENKQPTVYTVRMVSGHSIGLTQVQFEELLHAMPVPYDAERRLKHSQAMQRVKATMSLQEWVRLSDDEKDDLVSAEVSRAASQQ